MWKTSHLSLKVCFVRQISRVCVILLYFSAGIFLAGVSGISAIIGFGATVASAKKQDPKYFDKGMIGARGMHETGVSLAMRALGWGTLYAFTGCGVLFYSIWKLSGANNVRIFYIYSTKFD